MPSSISIECHVCDTNFVNRSELIEHLRLDHGQSFDVENRNEIANQQKNELEEENDEKSDKTKDLCVCTESKCKKVHKKKKQFHCKQCDKYFTLKASLTRHNNEVHEEKPFDCKKCGRSYTSERALKAHNNSVHAKKESIKQIYKCDLCYSDFKTKDELEKHQTKVDKGNKVYQCSICRACFLSKRGLKNHVKNSHTDLTKYKCNNEIANTSHVCNINHVDNSALKKQLPALKKSTCLNMPSSISIATKCHDCDTNYLDNSALKVHLALEHGQSSNVHEEEKPFRCEKCKTSYKLKGSLTRHNNLVHEGKDIKEKAIIQKQKNNMKVEQKNLVHEGKYTIKKPSNRIRKRI